MNPQISNSSGLSCHIHKKHNWNCIDTLYLLIRIIEHEALQRRLQHMGEVNPFHGLFKIDGGYICSKEYLYDLQQLFGILL